MHVEECEGFKKEEMVEVLSEFSDILSEIPGKTKVVKMNIELQEGTGVISQMPYRLPNRLKEAVEAELPKAEIIEESESAWASPLVTVAKPNGKTRLCIDFRKLNLATPHQQTYTPCLDDILDKVGQSSVLSKLDLSKGFLPSGGNGGFQ